MEIVTKVETIQRVIFKKARLRDYAIFVTIFGLFSIFGTYIGIPDSSGSGAISNIRELAPIVAGLVGGPFVGLSVGLIGGIHRFFLGGVTYIPCSLATILAGLLAGFIFHRNKGKLLGIIPAILFGVSIELMHAGLALLIVQPFSAALQIMLATIPQMIIAVSLGVGISVIIIHSTKEPAFTSKEKSQPKVSGLPEETPYLRLQGFKPLYFFRYARTSARKARGRILNIAPLLRDPPPLI